MDSVSVIAFAGLGRPTDNRFRLAHRVCRALLHQQKQLQNRGQMADRTQRGFSLSLGQNRPQRCPCEVPIATEQGHAAGDDFLFLPRHLIEPFQRFQIAPCNGQIQVGRQHIVPHSVLSFHPLVESRQNLGAVVFRIDDQPRQTIGPIHFLKRRVEPLEDFALERIENPHGLAKRLVSQQLLHLFDIPAIKRYPQIPPGIFLAIKRLGSPVGDRPANHREPIAPDRILDRQILNLGIDAETVIRTFEEKILLEQLGNDLADRGLGQSFSRFVGPTRILGETRQILAGRGFIEKSQNLKQMPRIGIQPVILREEIRLRHGGFRGVKSSLIQSGQVGFPKNDGARPSFSVMLSSDNLEIDFPRAKGAYPAFPENLPQEPRTAVGVKRKHLAAWISAIGQEQAPFERPAPTAQTRTSLQSLNDNPQSAHGSKPVPAPEIRPTFPEAPKTQRICPLKKTSRWRQDETCFVSLLYIRCCDNPFP